MHDHYDTVEFDSIEYMATSGGLGQADSDARMAYYGNNGMPHVLFNGGGMLVGAGTDVVDGSVYTPIVESHLTHATPLKMSISSFSFNGFNAYVTVDLELEGDIANMSQTKLRVALVEDGLNYGNVDYDHILRDMLPDEALTIKSQQVTINFPVDPTWVPENLRLIAFVQDDTDKAVLQSCNSLPAPDYSLRYYVQGETILIGSGSVDFEQSGLFNTGTMADTYDISLDNSNLPAGWSATFNHDGSDYTNLTLGLDPDARALFNVTIDAASAGQGAVTLTLHSQSGQTSDRVITFTVITSDVQVLLVDDDGGAGYGAQYFEPAIASTGKTSATWNRSSAGLSAEVLANFDVVVWQCGWAFPTVDEDDRAALTEYLDGGGSLFITGQDIGWEMYDQGGASQAWYNNYLHASFVNDDTNMLNLTGVPGDPIADGLSFGISGGDGANNQEYPSDIDPLGTGASTILTYDSSRNGGIKADTGTYKVVYLAFGFEAIDNATARAELMQGIVGWLLPSAAGVSDQFPGVIALRGNVPNPFNPQTDIHFTVGKEANVKLGVYDVKGHLLRTLDAGVVEAGDHSVLWDGNDHAGRSVPSGTYFARVQGEGKLEAVKMMLVR